MSNMEVPVIKVAHIPGDLELQVPLGNLFKNRSDCAKIAVTLGNRRDVTKAWLGHDDFLHVYYAPRGLDRKKRDQLVERLKEKIIETIEHKLELHAAASTKRTTLSTA